MLTKVVENTTHKNIFCRNGIKWQEKHQDERTIQLTLRIKLNRLTQWGQSLNSSVDEVQGIWKRWLILSIVRYTEGGDLILSRDLTIRQKKQ